ALFSLIGTIYGGNGAKIFGLPHLNSYAPLCAGTGLGLSPYDIGEVTGEGNVSLKSAENAADLHTLFASGTQATELSASGTQPALATSGGKGQGYIANMYSANAVTTMVAPNAIGPTGSGQPHNNMQPYLTLNFCIALKGIFPQRN